MEKSNLVLGLLEATLGSGKKDRKTDNYSFHCPFCKHHKPKLVVNVDTGNYNCWTCSPATKGKNPVSLLKKLRAPIEHIKEMATYFSVKIKTEEISDIQNVVSLPTEFVSLLEDNSSLDFKRAKSYLKSRGITTSDIQKYNIGYCQTGRYQDRIIVPSYDNNGVLNYFIARSLDPNSTRKYDAPSCKKAEIVGMENTINWEVPVILCEGAFDAIAIKRNVIPLFGKTIPSAVMKKLVETKVKTVYLALDEDALSNAVEASEKLLNYGKEVYFLELKGKDPSKLGFESMIKLLHSAKPLTFSSLFSIKMKLI